MKPDEIFSRRPHTVDSLTWKAIGPVICDLAAEVVTKRPETNLEHVRAAITRHVLYCYCHGLPLERGVLLDEYVIERHYMNFDGTVQTRKAHHSTMKLAARILNGSLPQRRPVHPDYEPEKPYSPAEIEKLLTWTTAARSSTKRDNRLLVFALAYGAALKTN
ncbi:hypothetical protein HW450_03655 [Corynebacterium hindlerae]|uniref:Integrase n=1 Tax=Corynebacterium hindlerae TaxID=699041 RepID=A0A7G5FGU9_9CORY|nr:hypothetical protein [Corynebacterium hindlerae]QMV85840.1 hypothetical protein HW450_03655 [Corynebacterium hindlerae]